MSQGPVPTRLRDEPDEQGSVAARAGALIRAIDPPAPLAPEADARILAALRPGHPSPLHFPRRLFAFAGACLVLVGTGIGARAAIEWMRRDPQPVPPSQAVPPAPRTPPRAAPLSTPPAASPRVAIAVDGPANAGPRGFSRAQRLIDPNDRAYRPRLTPEQVRAHVGKTFSWRVMVCVSETGAVTTTTSNDTIHPGLDRQVLAAIQRWRYRPARRAGKPIRSCAPLRYELKVTEGG